MTGHRLRYWDKEMQHSPSVHLTVSYLRDLDAPNLFSSYITVKKKVSTSLHSDHHKKHPQHTNILWLFPEGNRMCGWECSIFKC